VNLGQSSLGRPVYAWSVALIAAWPAGFASILRAEIDRAPGNGPNAGVRDTVDAGLVRYRCARASAEHWIAVWEGACRGDRREFYPLSKGRRPAHAVVTFPYFNAVRFGPALGETITINTLLA